MGVGWLAGWVEVRRAQRRQHIVQAPARVLAASAPITVVVLNIYNMLRCAVPCCCRRVQPCERQGLCAACCARLLPQRHVCAVCALCGARGDGGWRPGASTPHDQVGRAAVGGLHNQQTVTCCLAVRVCPCTCWQPAVAVVPAASEPPHTPSPPLLLLLMLLVVCNTRNTAGATCGSPAMWLCPPAQAAASV
jgi:hypothetical protein